MNYNLPQEYINLGFTMAKFGEKSLALKHREKTIFVFGSSLDLRDDFISRLCDNYMKLFSYGIKIGLSC